MQYATSKTSSTPRTQPRLAQVQRGCRRISQDRVRADHRPPEHLCSRHRQALRRFQGFGETGPLERRAPPPGWNPSADEAEPMDTDFETSSMDEAEAMEIDEAPLLRDWRTLYLDWMIRGILPSDHAQARRLARWAKSFVVIDRELYKRSPSGIL